MQITLDIPENLYQPLLNLAQKQGQSPEALAIQYLTTSIQLSLPNPQTTHELQAFFKTIQAIPSSAAITPEEIEAEIAAYRRGS